MRDAIQGMLSMSQMGGRGAGTLGSLGRGSPFIERTKPALRLHREAAARRRNQSADGAGDGGTGGADRMHTAYRDDEYGECCGGCSLLLLLLRSVVSVVRQIGTKFSIFISLVYNLHSLSSTFLHLLAHFSLPLYLPFSSCLHAVFPPSGPYPPLLPFSITIH
jgi:hypothetical protein